MKHRTRLATIAVIAAVVAAIAGTTARNAGAGTIFLPRESCIIGAAIGYSGGLAPYIRGAGAVSCSAEMSNISATYCFFHDQGPGTGSTLYSCSSNSDSYSNTLQGTIRHNCSYTTIKWRWWLEVSVVATDLFGSRGGGYDISNGIVPYSPGCGP
jgi:hypothetical protein